MTGASVRCNSVLGARLVDIRNLCVLNYLKHVTRGNSNLWIIDESREPMQHARLEGEEMLGRFGTKRRVRMVKHEECAFGECPNPTVEDCGLL